MHKSVSASVGLLFWCRNKGNEIAEKILRRLRVHGFIENHPMWPLLFRYIFFSNIQMSRSMNKKGNELRSSVNYCLTSTPLFTTEFITLSLFPRHPLTFQIFLLCTSACLTSTSLICTLLLVVFPLTPASLRGDMYKLLLRGPRVSQPARIRGVVD